MVLALRGREKLWNSGNLGNNVLEKWAYGKVLRFAKCDAERLIVPFTSPWNWRTEEHFFRKKKISNNCQKKKPPKASTNQNDLPRVALDEDDEWGLIQSRGYCHWRVGCVEGKVSKLWPSMAASPWSCWGGKKWKGSTVGPPSCHH